MNLSPTLPIVPEQPQGCLASSMYADRKAEKIPFEPEADNADAGREKMTDKIDTALKESLSITVNDQPRTFSGPLTLSQLLERIDLHSERGVAVAVNSSVIPKAAWASHQISDHDSILLITATQGG